VAARGPCLAAVERAAQMWKGITGSSALRRQLRVAFEAEPLRNTPPRFRFVLSAVAGVVEAGQARAGSGRCPRGAGGDGRQRSGLLRIGLCR
jgi:hypothetical protein